MSDRSDPFGNGWKMHELSVLERLEDHTERLQRVEESVSSIRESLGETRGKQLVWAAVVSIVIAAGASAAMALLFRAQPSSEEARRLNQSVEVLIQELRAKQALPRLAGDQR